MAITSLPTPPSRSDPENFPERADAFMAALPQFASEANALQEEVAEAVEATAADALGAASSREAAQASQSQAAQSALAAEVSRQAAGQMAGEAVAGAQLAQQWANKMGAPVDGSAFSAKHYAELAARGAGLPVYMPGSVPTLDVGPIYIAGKGIAEWNADTGQYHVRFDTPVGAVAWWPLRSSIPAGRIPADGFLLARATCPELAQMVIDGKLPVVTEEEWLADPLKRGCYTLGDDSTTIRVPDYNGMSPGAVAAVTLRGDGARSAGTAGTIQRDQLGPMSYQVSDFSQASNVLLDGTGKAVLTSGALSTATMRAVMQSSLGQKWITNTGEETRMTNVSGVWTIQAFGVVTNPGSADAAQLASDYASLNAAFQSLQGKAFGYEQTLIDVLGTRSLGVIYTNSTGRPIVVYIQGFATAANAYIFGVLNEVLATISNTPFSGGNIGVSFVVPPGATYRAGSSYTNIASWREYR